MAWIGTAMVAGAGLSYMGTSAANAKVSSTASANLASTQALASQNYEVQKTDMLNKAEEVKSSLGMELTNLLYQSAAQTGTATTQIAEKNMYGNTAQRVTENIKTKSALSADQLMQAADSKITDINTSLRNAKYQYESGNIQAGINYNNTMLNVKGKTEMVTGALSTGLSFGSAASSLSKG